jgi:lysophospholipase L1-like esterase
LNRQATCAFLITLESEPLDAMRFLAFGDSITAGADGTAGDLRLAAIDPAASYPTALRRALQADFPNQEMDVLNRGVGGEPASCDSSPTFCGEGRLRGELFEFRPDVLLLLHGYNDLLAEGADAVDQVVDATARMIRNASELGLRAVFVGALTPGRTATGPRDRQIDPAAIRLTNEQLAALSSREGAYFVDLHAAFSGRETELVADDGLHPTELGNAVIAETFYARILEVLQASGLTPARASGRWPVR